jgi:hypothetical protein
LRNLLQWACGPRNFMKNPPGANGSRIKGEQKAGFSTLSLNPAASDHGPGGALQWDIAVGSCRN